MRFSRLVLCLAASLTLVSSASQANHNSPGLVWVDAHGKAVGTPFMLAEPPHKTSVLIPTSWGLASANVSYEDYRYERLSGYLSGILYSSTDCSGAAVVDRVDVNSPARSFNAGDTQVNFQGSDLVTFDISEPLALGTYLSARRGGSCIAVNETLEGFPVTFVEEDFLNQFTPPFHLEQTGSFAFLPTGPWWLTVALLGTGFALQWRYFRRKESR